ncbi:MAG: MBL fold metallo-hydrolase [Acidimicrobiales bacterium]|nr:MBL fold metallo-hydrolase [Acidimicrobiales bacterium]
MSALLRLHPDVHLNVAYRDRTLGSPTGDRPEQLLAELFAPVVERVRRQGYAGLVGESPRLLADVVTGEQFRAFADVEVDSRGVRGWTVHDEILFPDPLDAPPRRLTIASPDRDRVVRVQLTPEHWAETHRVLSRLDGPGLDPASVEHADLAALVRVLVDQGLAAPSAEVAPPVPDEVLRGDGVTFLGHNTVLVRSGERAVLVDPLLFARRGDFPADYQPLGARDLGPVDAIVITHSHRDHFDPASLLRFAPDTTVVVPDIARETVVTIDLARRLGELGFTDVVRLPWGGRHDVGDIGIEALPFYGEQPTDGDVLHPEIRNEGNTYLITTPEARLVLLADAGRDGSGSMADVAAEVRRRGDAVDAVFIGYRGWVTYPVQLLFSSVGRYLWFVPPWLWDARLTLMLTPDQAVDLAERFGARLVIPYADGGAPWHWALGLGPRLDGHGAELPGFDLFPERLVEACDRRAQHLDASWDASRSRPLLLRPGDVTTHWRDDDAPRVHRVAGHGWPSAWPSGAPTG